MDDESSNAKKYNFDGEVEDYNYDSQNSIIDVSTPAKIPS